MAGSGNAGGDSRNGRAGNDQPGDGELKTRVIMALIAVILGGSGSALYQNVNPPRPDPFTGSMGKEMEARVAKRNQAIEDRIETIRSEMNAHFVRGEAGFWRIQQLEKQCDKLQTELNTMRQRNGH